MPSLLLPFVPDVACVPDACACVIQHLMQLGMPLPTHASQEAEPQLACDCVTFTLALAAQGHLRLVLAPIVYNAMAQKACLRALPLYRALRRVLRASTYDPLLHHPPAHTLPNVVGRCVQSPLPDFLCMQVHCCAADV